MKKREREPEHADSASNPATSPSGGGGGAASTTNFRNVSACNRCRNRKNRCDQKLPKCTNCEKAQVSCVGFDPVSKREIPRSYVYYLETRVVNLEAILTANNIAFPPPQDDFAISDAIKPGVNVPFPVLDDEASAGGGITTNRSPLAHTRPVLDPALKDPEDETKLDKLVDNIGMVSVRGTADPRHGPSASATGISFAKVVYAAVKRSKDQTPTPSEKGGPKASRAQQSDATGSTVHDSFFGLNCRSNIKPAPFPDRTLGLHLLDMYFEHANPQIPVLHRGSFTELFERVYANDAKKRTPRELYMLNIVYAIGSGIVMASGSTEQNTSMVQTMMDDPDAPGKKRQRTVGQQCQPEEYHAAAIVHLEHFLGASPSSDGVSGGLEELQAVCLLAGLALLRPVAPGLWYIIGVAVRLSIDLGLHSEDVDHDLDSRALHPDVAVGGGASGLGRKQWNRDIRRRLWWCVFNLDRLVSSCVGRPVSIYEAVVTTEFPSMLDDKYITPAGFLKPPNEFEIPSYKFVTQHYLRLRLLQSEILQVFQHRQADSARELGANRNNWYIIPDLKSAFLQRFDSFRDWRADIDRRLWEWKESAPRQSETGVAFTPLFLDLNYWQAIIMLYRQSLSVPEPLAGELSPATGEDMRSPGAINQEREEDQQIVFLKVAQAGQTVLKIYRQLHRLKRVNYTFLATHHLFMSGISFLYAIWHSTLVRSQLTIDDVDFTVLAATSVLGDLAEKCEPAEACKDAFVRMSKATISMVMSTTGFGNASTLGAQRLNDPETWSGSPSAPSMSDGLSPPMQAPSQPLPPPPHRSSSRPSHQQHHSHPPRPHYSRPLPKFTDLKDLFSDEELASRPLAAPRIPDYRRLSQQMPQMDSLLPTSSSSERQLSTSSYQTTPAAVNDAAYHPPPSFPDEHDPTQPADYAFDELDFLTDFSAVGAGDAGNLWDPANINLDFGSGLGTAGGGGGGGGAFDSSGAYDASGELFDTFFFGSNANGF